MELNPGNSLSRLLDGLVLVEAGQWAAATERLRSGLAEMPGHSQARAALAVCLFQQGDAQGAKSELDRAIAIRPDQSEFLRQWYRQRAQ